VNPFSFKRECEGCRNCGKLIGVPLPAASFGLASLSDEARERWCLESMTQPTCRSSGGFSRCRVLSFLGDAGSCWILEFALTTG
jgi:hypothetical protein